MFVTELVLRASTVEDRWVVMAPLVWQNGASVPIIVPVGLITDLASTSRFLRWLPSFDPNGRSRRPAVVHDWLYSCRNGKRRDADLFFKTALRAEGASWLLAEIYYLGVRWLGQHRWDEDVVDWAAHDFDTPEHYAEWRTGGSQEDQAPITHTST